MAITALSLPIDVPWRRLCVSDDMIDRKVCDRKFPYRWRSSVAVFAYQPPDEQQAYEGMIVSYLKVACTITGFQMDPQEVGIKDRRVDSYWNDPAVIENYKEMVSNYYGCYGAILEVAAAPSGTREEVANIPVTQYPYFADFEPKKRELYEMVSETGEIMSRSLENVNVRKGTTTTDGHEVTDSVGFSGKIGAEYKGIKGELGFQTQSGTRDMTQEEYTNIRSTDQGREMRETFSHTTELTQMYHQFNSYHLGTNRAVFFMLPRPHIVQADNTFVNGPRLLEGIQEIFLVVMRPKEVKNICVEAYLETAHIVNEPIYKYTTSTGTLTLHVAKKAVEVDLEGADDSQDQPAETSETYTPPDGWEVDLGRDGGYKIDSVSGVRYTVATVTEATSDHVTAFGRVVARYQDDTWPDENEFLDASLDMKVTVYIRKKKPDVEGYNQTLWLTGRGLCCCPQSRVRIPPSVVWEGPLRDPIKVGIGRTHVLTVRDANRIRAEVGQKLLQVVNHPNRYPFGTVGFTETRFLGRSMAALVRTDKHPDNHPVSQIKGMEPTIRDKIAQVAPKISRGRLLQMSTDEQIDRFSLSPEEARRLRRALLGLEGPLPDAKRRWDRPRGEAEANRNMPDLVALSLDKARKIVQGAGFRVGDVTYLDNVKPRGTVLNQYPNAGTAASFNSEVDLVVASGAIVQIPDVVGKPLSQALVMLLEAGLTSEPRIVFSASRDQPANHILEVTPEMRSYVTPHADMTLQVSSGADNP